MVRTAQTYAAPFSEVKPWAQQKLNRILRKPSDPDYRAFDRFPFGSDAQFLDIGANRGQTIASVRLYHPLLPVQAFEPNPILARKLIRRHADDPAITIHPFGLGTEDGHFDLYLPRYRGWTFDGLASFDPSSAAKVLNADTVYGFNRRHLRIEKVRCEVRRWDEVETRPSLVKIDVEGFESNVLSGGLETIREYRPTFLIENGLELDHERILIAEGYRRATFSGGRPVLDQVGRSNTYYIPEEKIDSLKAAYR
ncbi:FkbM family methyltransferase [Mycobacterium sp. GA-1285]|uniref:FkbM family methyltransferase n=1 Tax=Mycobacterium sp. GA-1285 TaxID=1772282 RepID=UPI00155F9B78|nr:FkbM family methyltransferase [Mycobacterium sp. GA-1285]